MYEAIGYPVSYLSVRTQTGIAALQAQLNNKTQLFLGQSGVGKSSSLKLLCQNEPIFGGEHCIKFPQSRMKGERHRLSSVLSLSLRNNINARFRGLPPPGPLTTLSLIFYVPPKI
jgi:hypothetical protein